MTVVLKNSAGGKPDSNFGATLFKKRFNSFQPLGQQAKAGDSVAKQPAAVAVATSKPQADLADSGACLKRALNLTASARASRERRLMTHLGLKGIDEEEWLTYAEFVKVNKYLGPSQMAPKSTIRIRFRFTFEENVLGMKKGEFIHETGPQFYSTGYLITYHLDRILGLYHIPPTVARKLSQAELQKIRGPGDSKWSDDILPKLLNDLSEPSVLSVPVPPVLKPEALSLKLRDTTVTSVEPFSRNQKVHLEYMLLWTLVKQSQPQQGHQGYKGHLIHFESDLAFNNLKTSVIGYFYHCQFPNSVYKTLVCYKCSDVNKMTRICGLGEEVMDRMKNSGVSPESIQIGNMNSGELSQVMNNGAASILTVVEHCIKMFGRESVLY